MGNSILFALLFAGGAAWAFPWDQPRWSSNRHVGSRTSRTRFVAHFDRRWSFLVSSVLAALAIAMLFVRI